MNNSESRKRKPSESNLTIGPKWTHMWQVSTGVNMYEKMKSPSYIHMV